MRKVIFITTILMILCSVPVFADDSFIENVNKKIDATQEIFNEIAEDVDETLEAVDEIVDETKIAVEGIVESISTYLSDLDNHWAKKYIDELVDRKIVAGYPDGTFKPNASISVSEFTKILMVSIFDDELYVTSNPWYQSYVESALDKGVIIEGEFDDYTREITRVEMAIMLARVGELQNKFEISNVDSTIFSDDIVILNQNKKYVVAVSDVGIITGYPNGDFGPNNEATRAEASVMLNRYLDLEIDNHSVEQEKTVVEQMLENVLATRMVSPTSISRIQQLVDKEETIFCRGGSYMEDEVLKVGDYTNFQSAIDNALKIGQVLQPHAESNDLMVAYVGGNGRAMGVTYGENVEQLNRSDDMFYMGYYRDVEWANEEVIDGENYEFDKNVTIGGGLFAGKRLERKYPDMDEYTTIRKSHIDMDEDILNAFYDGLRVMDPNRAEAMFEKMTEDYIYAKTHQYGDLNNSRKEFFEIDDQLIYQEDVRSADGHYRYITYRFVK